MQPELTLRRAQSCDVAFLRHLLAEDLSSPTVASAAAEYSARQSYYSERFPHARWQVVQLDLRSRQAHAVGAMLVSKRLRIWRLVDIALLPEFRNRGIGGALLTQLIEQSHTRDVRLRLAVLSSSPARRLYARLGFAVRMRGVHRLEMEWCGDSLAGYARK